MQKILADITVSMSEFKKNPAAVLRAAPIDWPLWLSAASRGGLAAAVREPLEVQPPLGLFEKAVALDAALRERLSERQRQTLEAAYYAGFRGLSMVIEDLQIQAIKMWTCS